MRHMLYRCATTAAHIMNEHNFHIKLLFEFGEYVPHKHTSHKYITLLSQVKCTNKNIHVHFNRDNTRKNLSPAPGFELMTFQLSSFRLGISLRGFTPLPLNTLPLLVASTLRNFKAVTETTHMVTDNIVPLGSLLKWAEH